MFAPTRWVVPSNVQTDESEDEIDDLEGIDPHAGRDEHQRAAQFEVRYLTEGQGVFGQLVKRQDLDFSGF